MLAPDGAAVKLLITTILMATLLSTQAPNVPLVTINGAVSPLENATLDWALGRYHAAGLDLPEFTVEFAGPDGCGGNTAIAIHGLSRPQIVICSKLTAAPEVVLKRTLLHEIAHIWIADALDERTRAAFLKLRGLTSWADKTVPWQDRGSEHAAEIMAWGLMDGELLLATLSNHDPVTLGAGFELLTESVAGSG